MGDLIDRKFTAVCRQRPTKNVCCGRETERCRIEILQRHRAVIPAIAWHLVNFNLSAAKNAKYNYVPIKRYITIKLFAGVNTNLCYVNINLSGWFSWDVNKSKSNPITIFGFDLGFTWWNKINYPIFLSFWCVWYSFHCLHYQQNDVDNSFIDHWHYKVR